MKKGKIIFSNYDDLNNPYYSGGGANVVHEIAKRLTKHYEVLVFTGNYSGAKDTIIDSVIYRRVGLPFLGPKLSQVIFPFLLIKHVIKNDYIIWIENFTPPFSFSLLPIFARNSLIGFAQMLAGEDMERKYKLPFTLIEKIGLKLYKNITVINESDAQKLIKTHPSVNLQVIPVGVELPDIRKTATEKHLLYIGRIEINQKGLDLLIDSYSKSGLVNKIPLVIAGTGVKSELDILKKHIKKNNLEKYISVVGRVSGKEKVDLFLQAYAVIVPSRFETFCITALESMSYCKPVIAFDIPGLSWAPNGLIIKNKKFDCKLLANSISTIVKDKSKRMKLGEDSRKFAQSFNWNRIGNMYVDYINSMVN